MGFFDFNNKSKQIEDMLLTLENNHKKYVEDATQLNRKIDLIVRDYNDQIPIINNIRNGEFGPQINKLYKFLGLFGDNGVEISPFDFVTEKSRVMHHQDINESSGHKKGESDAYTDFAEQLGAGFMAAQTAASISLIASSSALIAPLGIPFLLKAIFDDQANKKKIQEIQLAIENDSLSFKKDLAYRNQYLASMNDAVAIAEIYRVTIKTLSQAIESFILPEMGLVKSFLLAEDAKNKIIANDSFASLEIGSILYYKDTPYHRHYQFVQNAFHFYSIITEFFSKPILTTLLEDFVITPEEKAEFEQSVANIKNAINEMKDSCVLNEVITFESR